MERRYGLLADLQDWTEDMVSCLVARAARFTPRHDDPWPAFRWHDSGDLQSVGHLEAICDIAERTQDVALADGTVHDIRYWLPTREYGYVKEVLEKRPVFPRNLCVRLSAHMIDGPVPASVGLPVSSVHTRPDVYPESLSCPAYARGGGCGDCRACWDADVPHVSYPGH
jgi:hypothetical protein